MPFTLRVLAFAGSTREQSFNKKLVKIALRGAENAGAEVTYLDLRDLQLPLYDGDLEATSGLPAGARKLKDLMLTHHGFLISAPEYNSSISGVLKNSIDWASRPAPNEKPLECFAGKVAGLLSASPGALGGMRSLIHVRAILENIGTFVIPTQFSLMKAAEAFNPDGSLKDASHQTRAEAIAAKLVDVIRKLNS